MLSLAFQVPVTHRITGTFGVRCCGDRFTMIVSIFKKHRTFSKWLSEVLYFLKEGKVILASTFMPCSILKDLGVKDAFLSTAA